MPTFTVVELGARKGSEDENGFRTYVRRWRVTAPSTDYGPRRVVQEVGVRRGDLYEIGTFTKVVGDNGAVSYVPVEDWAERDLCYCNGIETQETDVEGDEDGVDWIVTATYGVWNPDKTESPLDEPPDLSWSFASYNRLADRAYDDEGNLAVPIVNTAGDPFDPPTEIDDPRPVLTVVVNLPYPQGYSPARAYAYRNAVNADEFFSVPPGYVKAVPPVAQRLYHPECGFYWKVTYEFHFNPDGWLRTILNQGTRQLNAAGDGYASILTETGQLATDPVPLDQDGRALGPGDDPLFLDFAVYPVKPFVDFYGFGGPVDAGSGPGVNA